ncbi:Winged helix-turn-helix DNA-binding domain [Cinara cedri]|uniref:Winged helix-turn-helix DNA-binding domain n=1 Tax=Cinara cedri TaxID=506608 RepID=A0A5E4MLJ8_9HEMI|nr:Winged helix-turn-helix DNA-binding domain [Cinara cedri]
METYDKLVKVFGDEVLSRAQMFRWHKNFKNDRESVGDEPRSGRPVEARTDNNVQRVRTLVHQDRRLTVRMLADELNLKRETVRKILTDDLSMKKLCAKMNIAVLPQAPYSPDMSSCDFFLFPQTKLAVKGTHFESITDIQNAVTRILQDIPVEAFQKCYESWKKRWNQCIGVGGEYFEGDHIDVS